jgi:hypothetical protein
MTQINFPRAGKSVLLALVFAAAAGANAQATTVTQSVGPLNSDTSNWNRPVLGSVTFASGTNNISGLTSSMTINDQGWGGQDPVSNNVYIGLYNNNNLLWATSVAGAYHYSTNQTFDITAQPSLLTSLNSAMGSIDWSSNPTVNMSMVSNGLGYPGWQLHTRNATFSVTSSAVAAVPEPETYAMMLAGFGLLGFVARRKSRQVKIAA